MIEYGFMVNVIGITAFFITFLGILDAISLTIPKNLFNVLFLTIFAGILINTTATILALLPYAFPAIIYLTKRISKPITKNWDKYVTVVGTILITISVFISIQYYLTKMYSVATLAWGAVGLNYVFTKNQLEVMGSADTILLAVFATMGPFAIAIYAAAEAFGKLFIRYTVFKDRVIIGIPLITGMAIAYDITALVLSVAYNV